MRADGGTRIRVDYPASLREASAKISPGYKSLVAIGSASAKVRRKKNASVLPSSRLIFSPFFIQIISFLWIKKGQLWKRQDTKYTSLREFMGVLKGSASHMGANKVATRERESSGNLKLDPSWCLLLPLTHRQWIWIWSFLGVREFATISNPHTLSRSETGVDSGIRSWKKHLSE